MKKKGYIILVVLLVLWVTGAAEIDRMHFGSMDSPLDGLTVTWRGNYSHCNIKWGYTDKYEQVKPKSIEGRVEFGDTQFYLYDFTFPTPEPSKVIHFALQECSGPFDGFDYEGDWTKDYTFQTSKKVTSEQFTFIAGGDSRGEPGDLGMEKWKNVAEVLKDTKADFYLYMGDISLLGGNKLLWDTWYRAGKNFLAQKLIYHSAGNHERYGDPGMYNYLNQFVLPENGDIAELYYSFEFGNAVFITLNTEFNSETKRGSVDNQKQTKWLAGQLEKYRGKSAKTNKNYKEWVIICYHKPFFTVDKHMGEMTGGKDVEDPAYCHDFAHTWWIDLFDKYGVDVIFNGHTHLYMRAVPLLLAGNGITFNDKGLPSKPKKAVQYGNKKGQGRLQVVTGGYGVNPIDIEKLKKKGKWFGDEWYVEKYKLVYHYCEVSIDGKKLEMVVKSTADGEVFDRVTIEH